MLPDQIIIRPGITANIDGEVMDSAAAAESSADPRLYAGYPQVRDLAPTSATVAFSANKRGHHLLGGDRRDRRLPDGGGDHQSLHLQPQDREERHRVPERLGEGGDGQDQRPDLRRRITTSPPSLWMPGMSAAP